MTKVLIIEDEVSARNHLVKLLGAMQHDFEVLATLGTVEECVRWLQKQPGPDLIFMDIHLSDGISFDVLAEVNVTCPIIYITAYDQYAIKAFKTMGIDYLLKPIGQEDLETAIDKYRQLTETGGDHWLMKNLETLKLAAEQQKTSYQNRFLLKSGTQLVPVRTEEVAWFHRKGDLVFAHTFADKSYLADQPLNHLQKVLDPELFFRLNRQVLVNLNAVVKLKAYKPGQVTVSLQPEYPETLHLSQERSSKLKSVLG